MDLLTMKETAVAVGVAYTALQRAVFDKRIPELKRKAGWSKLLAPDEVEQARQYFATSKRRTGKG